MLEDGIDLVLFEELVFVDVVAGEYLEELVSEEADESF
jgi:hypothetical protein